MSKYHNKKVRIDDYVFDSIKESEKYLELKNLKAGGQVREFTVHPKFLIIEGFEKELSQIKNLKIEQTKK